MNIVLKYGCKHFKQFSLETYINGIKHRELYCVDCHKYIEILTQEEYEQIFEPKLGGTTNEVV